MISWEGGSRFFDFLKNSRNSRLIRFRSTAPPRSFPTDNPRRVRPRVFGRRTARKFRERIFLVFGDRRIKSRRLRIRSSRVKVWNLASNSSGDLSGSSPGLNRQSLPSLGPSAFYHFPPGARAHPFQETMGPGPTNIAGLKCPFHKYDFSLEQGNLYLNHREAFLSSYIYSWGKGQFFLKGGSGGGGSWRDKGPARPPGTGGRAG